MVSLRVAYASLPPNKGYLIAARIVKIARRPSSGANTAVEHAMRIVIFLVLFAICSGAAAQTPLRASMAYGYFSGSAGTPQVIFSDTNGSAGLGPRLIYSLSRTTSPAPPPPYQVRIEFSPGLLSATPLALPAGASCQPTSGGGAAPLVLQCTLNTLIAGTPNTLQIAVDAGPFAGFPGSVSVARATVDYAAFPLPEPPNCQPSPSETGCLERTSPVFESRVGLTSLTTPNPMTVGNTSLVTINHWVVGYDDGRITTTDIDLPPELEFLGVRNVSAPFHTCTLVPDTDGDRVSCTGNLRHLTANGAQRNGDFGIWVRTRPGVEPPGPLQIVARIGNEAQPAPENCTSVPEQPACATLQFGLIPAPIVDLRLTESTAPQPYVMLGRAQGPFVVRYRNAGGVGSAVPTRILAKLPAGFEFLQGSSIEGPITCTGSGAVEDGQEVRCARGTPVAASSSTFSVSLVIQGDPQLSALSGNLIVWAITDGPQSDGDALLACAADPDLLDCRWQPFAVRPPCPGGPADSIFCEGFQVFTPPEEDTDL